tara:strand:+ start:4311 stop:5150 length:840 start_codon:yes stop_codon:yes gene_type:complete
MAGEKYILGASIDPKVADVMSERGKQSMSSAWRTERRPWMKIHSFSDTGMVDISGDTSNWDIAKRYVKDSSTGLRLPMPSLTSIDVKSTGQMGSLRKTTIKFDVFGFDQLRKVKTAFFVPGMSMYALWGWNKTQAGTPVSSNHDVAAGAKSHVEVHNAIQKLAIKYDYCFDGIAGVISSFDWDKQASGISQVISCTLTVESIGTTQLKANVQQPSAKNCGCKCTSSEDTKDVVGGWVKQALFNVAQAAMDARVAKAGGEVGPWKMQGVIVGCNMDLDQD